MAPKTLFDLPTELLDRIYSYLDWDRTTNLVPHRPDILHISLTCKHLRESIIPLVFRNVTLCLRWVAGALTEPSLLALRRHRPDLAQHIRCVYVSSKVGRPGYWPDQESQDERPRFSVPEDVEDWLNPELAVWPDSRHYTELNAAHRARVHEVVRELFKSVSESCELATDADSGTAEAMVCQMVAQTSYASRKQKELLDATKASGAPLLSRSVQRQRNEQQTGSSAGAAADQVGDDEPPPAKTWRMGPADRHLKQQTDALAAVMLCLPATLIELVFDSTCTDGPDNSPQNRYAMHVAAAAMQVFGSRLESLTATLSNHLSALFRVRGPNALQILEQPNSDTVTPDIVSGLTNLKSLVLASTSDPQGKLHFGGLQRDVPHLERWHALHAVDNLTTLDFWNMHVSDDDADKLVKAIPHFHALQRIGLKNICLSIRNTRGHIQPGLEGRGEVTWLRFLIALRRATPSAVIELGNPHCEVYQARGLLTQSAVKWLVTEAVPAGAVVDLQREERLFEDFESFLFCWSVEDGVRGRQAAKERESGALVDAAFCSRWKQFENVRRDQGEWTTI
ncbi:hypothetical protein LTR36_010154 [Oleoguttula mirabilis]|uniref:F-box domain-containing protein n=1 Tax=Oleoguttula mirabilis TaxID=1507867 RepID=A0AAV9JS39_9PEZI|nr:hypothetical protein LTR36_010154 [Oleoguttula mirabilis]